MQTNKVISLEPLLREHSITSRIIKTATSLNMHILEAGSSSANRQIQVPLTFITGNVIGIIDKAQGR